MNTYKKVLVIMLLFFTVLPGCKKGWLDINYDPQQLSDKNAEPFSILPVVLDNAPAFEYADIVLQYWMGYWCPPPPYPTGVWESTYDLAGIPQGISAGKISRIPLIENLEYKAAQTNQAFYTGIAKIIKAMHWSREVDFRNNVPYTEAFKIDISRPKYDKGKDIYEDCMKQLDAAIQLIKNADVGRNNKISLADIMFHGDKIKWIKFANTLKLRLLVHQANRPDRSSYITAEITKIRAEGTGFLNSGENANVNPGYTEAPMKSNPYYDYFSRGSINKSIVSLPDGSWFGSWQLASANVTALNILKDNNDPRLAFFYEPISSPVPPGAPEPFSQPAPDNFRGNKLGLPVNSLVFGFQQSPFISKVKSLTAHDPVSSNSTGIVKGYDMDKWVLTSTESLFLQAEAIQRGWITGNAEQAYKNAIKESFRWLNVGGNSTLPSLSDAVFENWYNSQVGAGNQQVSWQAAPDKYKLIMFQKYIAFIGIDPIESYTDYRRNGGYPDIAMSFDPARLNNSMPVRIPYAVSEYLYNAENVNAEGLINVFNSKIWWMP
jgi:hypothetical protein